MIAPRCRDRLEEPARNADWGREQGLSTSHNATHVGVVSGFNAMSSRRFAGDSLLRELWPVDRLGHSGG